jgi:tetratricopeptide (TPR) repeat protein
MTGREPVVPAPDFAQLLRELRHRAGLTQEELATAAGLSPRALGSLERGRAAPRRDTTTRLAEALRLADADAELLRRLARSRFAAEHARTTAYDAAMPPVVPGHGASSSPGEPADSARAHSMLGAEATCLFAVIGLHPTPQISAEGLAAAADLPAETTRRLLDQIAQVRLIAWSAPDEIEIAAPAHALARAQAGELLTDAACAAARDRLVHWYLATADTADRVIAPLRFRASMTETVAGRPHRAFSGRPEALAWCDRHQETFGALATLAYRTSNPRPAWQIPWALGAYLDLRRPPELSLRIHQVGLACATERGDLLGQAAMLGGLGLAHYYPRRFDDAADCFREARKLWRQLGEPVGEAGALNCLGNVYLEIRRFSQACTRYREALDLYRKTGDRRGEAVVLTNLAESFCESADFAQATEHARAAVLAGRDAAYPRIEVMAACQLARALAATGKTAEADGLFEQALALSRSDADRHALAWTLTYLGYHLRSRGAPDQASAAWREAIGIFDELVDPHAARLCAELVTLTGPR